MDPELKKAVMLLKSLIFHYHGLDEEERILLEKAAEKYHAEEEMNWANSFISEDYLSAYERGKEYLAKIFKKLDKKTQLLYLAEVWEENHQKGYVTEMETTAMINLAKDWAIEAEFLRLINH